MSVASAGDFIILLLNKMSDLINYKQTDEYQHIVDECRTILTQRIKNSRMEVILAYGEIGEVIIKSKVYQKYAKSNQGFVGDLARDMGISYSEASRAIQFYEKFGKDSLISESIVDQFEEGENISWHKIKTRYLTEGAEKRLPAKTFYKLDEIKRIFVEWFNQSKSTQAEEALSEFLDILIK